jgi:hypothetical protein
MFTRMGVPTFSIGAYTDPAHPTDDKRPALPDAPYFPELREATERQRAEMTERHGDPGPYIDWGKANLAPEVIDWADTIIVHHFPEQWIGGNWERIRGKRVIWRTCGQSDPRLESAMRRYRREGLQIVRYSPREREAFETWGSFAGEDVLIRFGKDPGEWHGWTGRTPVVGNITQHMAQRGDACGYWFWVEATRDLPTMPAGPGSDILVGGLGSLDYEDMREYLRNVRVYLYTGTRPASYTLGLIEAMMTGTPVISIGGVAFGAATLFEGDSITRLSFDKPDQARAVLSDLLNDYERAARIGIDQRLRAIDLFGLDIVMDQWADFLGLGGPLGEEPRPLWGAA